MFRHVPVLPVVIPIAVLIFVSLTGYLHRRERLSVPRAAVVLALSVYVAGIIANTVFPIYLDKPAAQGPWKVYLAPFSRYDVADAVTNVVVFVPLGILVPLLVARSSWARVLLTATATSLVIELSQLVSGHLLGGGHVADVHDLIFNVVGGMLGYGFFCLISLAPGADRLVARFSLRETGQSTVGRARRPARPPQSGHRGSAP